MILLSDELQLIANNSKCFANGIKPIIRNKNIDEKTNYTAYSTATYLVQTQTIM